MNKSIYISHPTLCIEKGKVLSEKIRKMGWVVLNPFDVGMSYDDIVQRDLEMIDMVDNVLIYIPEAVFTIGVGVELHYAFRIEKVLWCFASDQVLGNPFISKYIPKHRRFESEDKLLSQLRFVK
jgi:hypothetical protein